MTSLPRDHSTRIEWMDSVRGTAILLLLVWHASAIPELFGQDMPGILREINSFFLPYRMPTLMLLSGVLLAKSLRKPLPQYYAGKFAMILWPYVVWVLIARATFLDVEGLSWWHWRGWYATSYLWFLFYIGVYYLVAPLFRRVPPWVPVALATVGATLLPYGTVEQRLLYFAVFFFAGSWLAASPETFARLTSGRAALIFLAPVVAFGVAATVWTDALQYATWGAPFSIAGALLLAALYSWMERRGVRMTALRFMGRSSIVYYVSHFPVMALISLAWPHLHPLAIAGINLIAGLAVGTGLAYGKKMIPFRWLFEAPEMLTAGVRRLLALVTRQPAR